MERWGMTVQEFVSRANGEDARRAVGAYIGVHWDDGTEVRLIGRGEDRAGFLVDGIVYKVGGRDTANPYDHETLECARKAGFPWAPPSVLFEVYDWLGVWWPVLAMPYLEDDGSEADPEALLRMREETGGQVDGMNYVVRGGQPIVFDGCTVERGAWWVE